jgi:hypothetical protein
MPFAVMNQANIYKPCTVNTDWMSDRALGRYINFVTKHALSVT